MLPFRIAASEHLISRGALILDTNVLVSGFSRKDKHHGTARVVLDDWIDDLVVPVAVLIESWGILVGSRRDWEAGRSMVEWINTPGRAVLIPQPVEKASNVRDIVSRVNVDCVDVLIYQLAIELSRHFAGGEGVKIATYDTGDFYKCMKKEGITIELFDMRDLG